MYLILFFNVLYFWQSLIEEKNGKFVEYHHDKTDPTLSATMVREIINGELIVVRRNFFKMNFLFFKQI